MQVRGRTRADEFEGMKGAEHLEGHDDRDTGLKPQDRKWRNGARAVALAPGQSERAHMHACTRRGEGPAVTDHGDLENGDTYRFREKIDAAVICERVIITIMTK